MKQKLLILLSLFVLMSICIEAQDSSNELEEILIPCLEDSFDDDNMVGAWGIGSSYDESQAMRMASQDAIDALSRRFHVDNKEIAKIAQSWCRKYTRNDNGEYVVYVSIKVSKSKLLEIINKSRQ